MTDAGIITCNGMGEAYITIKSEDTGVSDTVKIIGRVPVKRIKLNSKKIKMTLGEKQSINASVSPENATYPGLIYKSMDESVVTVDEEGIITAVGIGTAIIKIKSVDDESISASCQVTVSEKDDNATNKLLGDVNNDNIVNASDALEILKYAARIIELSDEDIVISDVNFDSTVDASDALMVLKYAAKIIDSFNK